MKNTFSYTNIQFLFETMCYITIIVITYKLLKIKEIFKIKMSIIYLSRLYKANMIYISFCTVHFLNFILIKLEYSHELSYLDNKITKKHIDIFWIPITYGYYLCDAKNYIITNIICYLYRRTSFLSH